MKIVIALTTLYSISSFASQTSRVCGELIPNESSIPAERSDLGRVVGVGNHMSQMFEPLCPQLIAATEQIEQNNGITCDLGSIRTKVYGFSGLFVSTLSATGTIPCSSGRALNFKFISKNNGTEPLMIRYLKLQ